MKKTNNIKMLSYTIEDLRKIMDFFNQRDEEINAIDIKTPESDIFVDINSGCSVDTVLNFKDYCTNRTYKIVKPLHGEVTINNFRIMYERTTWNYDNDEGTG